MTPAALAELVRSVAHDVLTDRGLDPAVLPDTVTVHPPRDPEHGDYAITVALQAGMRAGVPPRELAGWLAEELMQRRGVCSAVVAGPGFVNLWLTAGAQVEIVRQVLGARERFGALQEPPTGGVTGLQELPTGGLVVKPPTGGLAAVEDRPTGGLAGLEELPTVEAAQYAHARLAATARQAADLGISCEHARLELLDHERESELIRMLGEYPRSVAAQPRRLVRYLDQLTSAYHRFDGSCRVLPMGDEEPGPRHVARLALCQATRQVLANGLGLLGAGAPERM
ncbi:MAG: DALR anticodon-binding domain-containing protein [Pseudonocardiaceae bacterium]